MIFAIFIKAFVLSVVGTLLLLSPVVGIFVDLKDDNKSKKAATIIFIGLMFVFIYGFTALEYR